MFVGTVVDAARGVVGEVLVAQKLPAVRGPAAQEVAVGGEELQGAALVDLGLARDDHHRLF